MRKVFQSFREASAFASTASSADGREYQLYNDGKQWVVADAAKFPDEQDSKVPISRSPATKSRNANEERLPALGFTNCDASDMSDAQSLANFCFAKRKGPTGPYIVGNGTSWLEHVGIAHERAERKIMYGDYRARLLRLVSDALKNYQKLDISPLRRKMFQELELLIESNDGALAAAVNMIGLTPADGLYVGVRRILKAFLQSSAS